MEKRITIPESKEKRNGLEFTVSAQEIKMDTIVDDTITPPLTPPLTHETNNSKEEGSDLIELETLAETTRTPVSLESRSQGANENNQATRFDLANNNFTKDCI